MKKIERALLSVWDKEGIVDFAQELVQQNVELLSTGGTAKALKEAGLPVTDVSEFTGFPEMLDGRVKTLHPKVHAGLLYMRDNPEHVATMQEHGLSGIDLVCVNLYPFEQTVAKEGVTFEEAIENIDIGGPTMIRSAAKNHADVTVVVDPTDYARVLQSMKENKGGTSPALRRELAFKVFSRAASYNAAIASYLAGQLEQSAQTAAPFVATSGPGTVLRYGENPHQRAWFYTDPVATEACVAHTEQLAGKEMSYNNYVDGEAALEAVKELSGEAGVAIIKHTNPCGYATGANLAEALEAAWAGDPVSAFGSVIAATQPVDLKFSEQLKGRFVEAIIAPDYTPEALDYLKGKSKMLRLLKLKHPMAVAKGGQCWKQINGGVLVQDRDTDLIENWNVPTATPFPEELRPLATFGMKACKHVKSNAIILVREYTPGFYSVLGMGAGQPNRVDSVRKLAVTKAKDNMALLAKQKEAYGQSPKELETEIMSQCVLISDAFFPFADNIENAAAAGIRYIVEPGGSKRDEEVISACDRFGIAMAFTGMRHFKH